MPQPEHVEGLVTIDDVDRLAYPAVIPLEEYPLTPGPDRRMGRLLPDGRGVLRGSRSASRLDVYMQRNKSAADCRNTLR